MKRPDNIIGIDPDVTKSGCALIKTSSKQIEVAALSLSKLLFYLQNIRNQCRERKESLVVVVEASWTNSHNHHIEKGSKEKASIVSKIGYNVGCNHQRGRDICELAKAIGLDVVEKTPLRKHWKGKDRKITHEELSYFAGIPNRTNQEQRDAVLLAWHYAGFPIKQTNDKKK
jgi:hypothetical protein